MGKNKGSVYLKAGKIDLAYEFNDYGDVDTNDISYGGNGFTIFVNDSTGATLFRNEIWSASGWYHATFYNPADGFVSFWGKGVVKIDVSVPYILHDDTTITGGDTPPAGSDGGTAPAGAASSSGAPTNPPSVPAATPRPPEVHAVIISGQSDPTKILRGNVHLVGGLIALGRQPGTPGTWDPGVTITPDAELVSGQKVPPVTPNLFDVRITRYEISATLEPPSSVTGQ